jgi:hypothetical protein
MPDHAKAKNAADYGLVRHREYGMGDSNGS